MTQTQFVALLSAMRQVLLVLGTVLAGKGLTDSGVYFWIETIAGVLLVIPAAAWELYDAVMNIFKAHAVGAQSAINMVAAGAALGADGTTLKLTGDAASTPPKPVTLATAAEIVKDFAPVTPAAKQ